LRSILLKDQNFVHYGYKFNLTMTSPNWKSRHSTLQWELRSRSEQRWRL